MKACSRWIVVFTFVCALVALHSLPLAAQSGATLEVTLEDEIGGVLVGAKVTLVQASTGQSREAVTDGEGVARIGPLTPGEYQLMAGAPGFRTEERAVTIGTGRPKPMLLRLGVEVTEVVEVEELRRPEADFVEIEQNADAVNVNDDVLVGIPMSIRGDRIIQFLSRFMNSAAGTPSIVIDGHEVTRLNLPPRAIDELVVNKNPYSAEYRRPGRARVEVISQDGSESHHHGDATFVFNDSAVSEPNPFTHEKPEISEMVGELGFSGPIRNTKGSFLFAAELGGDRATATVNALTLDGPFTSFVRERQRETFWTGRIDLNPSDRLDLSLRYEYEKETERNGGVGGLILPEVARNGDTLKQDIYFAVEHILSPSFVHQPSIHISHEHMQEGSDPTGSGIIVQGAFEGGVSQRFRDTKVFELDFMDTATYRKGAHVLRFGGRFSPSFQNWTDKNDFGGTFEFASLDAFAAGTPYVFKINEGDPNLKYRLHVADAHFQDEIKLREDFTLMLGVRWDWESIVDDYDNVAPRVAFSFAPGTKRTALRGGTGMFFERVGGTAYTRVGLYRPDKLRSLTYTNPSYPDYLAGGTATLPTPSIYQFAPGLQMPHLKQASIGLDHQLSLESTFSAEYVHLWGSGLFRARDINAPQPGTGLRPNPDFQNIIQIETSGRLKSDALHLTFNGEVGQFEGHVTYTLAKTYNDTPGANAGGALSLTAPSNSVDPSQEWGLADFDRRHRFSAAGVYEFPKEFQIGFVLDAMTGMPYEITTGFDDNGDSIANDRPVGLARNAGQSPRFFQLDLRLGKLWETRRPVDQAEDPAEFEVFVDIFNVFNTINYTDIVGVQSSPRFGLPSLAEKGRQIQAGFSWSF
jgi:hypothetical protein